MKAGKGLYVHGTVLSTEQSCMARRTDVLKAGREQVEERSANTKDVRIFLGRGPIMRCSPGKDIEKRGPGLGPGEQM